MNAIKRAQAPTPKFFKTLRTIGLVLAAIGSALVAAPIALPTAIITLGGYLAVPGGVVSAVSQLTAEPNTKENATD